MEGSTDLFEWAQRLECPPSILTDSVKKKLSKGIFGVLWEEANRIIYPANEVKEIRKNLLLYKLQHEPRDPNIQHIKNRMRLKAERQKLATEISFLEEECDQQEYRARRKVHELREIKLLNEPTCARQELLKMKYNEMKEQVENCLKMRQICEHLMPATCEDVDLDIVKQCLSIVSSLSAGADRKQVWNQVSETLSPIHIATLWNLLEQNQLRDFEDLIQLSTANTATDNPKQLTVTENMNIGIAKACGQHVIMTLKKLEYEKKCEEHQTVAMQYIEKIEQAPNRDIPEMNEWLELSLEVKKLEVEQRALQREVENIRQHLIDRSTIESDIQQLLSETRRVDIEIENYVESIHRSFVHLKSSESLINKARESLQCELDKVVSLRNDYCDTSWLDIDLGNELSVFQESFDIEATRKLRLKGDVGAYRHASRCFNASSIWAVPNATDRPSSFPLIRSPVYRLIDCYKVKSLNLWLAKLQSLPSIKCSSGNWEVEQPKNIDGSVFEVLHSIKSTCDKAYKEIRDFESTFDTWTNQPLKAVLATLNNSVNGLTCQQWEERYNILSHAIQSLPTKCPGNES